MGSNTLSESSLLIACIGGDKDAWDRFVEKYSDLVYHAVHKTMAIYYADFLYTEVEDIHNSIFLAFIEHDYKKLKQYRGLDGCTLASWIVTVTTNFTLNFITRRKPYISLDDDKEGDALKEAISDNRPSALDEMTAAEQSDLLSTLISELDTSDKLFLQYYYEDELSPEEIAGVMNLTVSAIYSKKSRIIEKLRNIAKKNKILQEISERGVK